MSTIPARRTVDARRPLEVRQRPCRRVRHRRVRRRRPPDSDSSPRPARIRTAPTPHRFDAAAHSDGYLTATHRDDSPPPDRAASLSADRDHAQHGQRAVLVSAGPPRAEPSLLNGESAAARRTRAGADPQHRFVAPALARIRSGSSHPRCADPPPFVAPALRGSAAATLRRLRAVTTPPALP
jgi:hypothetical protein